MSNGTASPETLPVADAERQRLLRRLMKREGLGSDQLIVAAHGPEETDFPLSFAQERLWFLHLLDPTSLTYHVVMYLPLWGLVDIDALQRALDAMVSRHEGFRTAFRDREGRPVQVILPPRGVDLATLDLSHVPQESWQAGYMPVIEKTRRTPYDLAAGDVFRATLVRLTEEGSVVLLGMHHIVTDGWSTGVIIRDLRALYEAFAGGDPDPLPQLTVQCADFAVAQREMFDSGGLEADLSFWRSQLAGLTPLPLPLDRARPDRPSGVGGVEGGLVSPEVLEALKELSRQEGTTLFRTTLAAFAVLLAGITGRTDVAVGSPVTIHRERPDLADVVGCFLNMLVLRVDVGGEPTFRELLRRVERVSREALTRQHVPFEAIVRDLRPDRESGLNPLFNVSFTLEQPHPTTAGWIDDMPLGQAVGLPTNSIRFELEANIAVLPDRLHVGLTYATDLFDAKTVKRWVDQLCHILIAIADDPSSDVRRLSRFPEAVMSTDHVRVAGAFPPRDPRRGRGRES